MSGMNRGQGSGPKRRIRTQRRSIDSTTCLIMRNRSKKAIPANWRELLINMVNTICDQPPKHFFNHLTGEKSIPYPFAHIAFGSLPTGMVEFTLDRNRGIARQQLQAIEHSLSYLDVKYWPIPKPKTRVGAGKECFINTGLHLNDTLFGINKHWFNPSRLQDVPGINWMHLEQYVAKRSKAEFLGIKTTCGEPCSCRRTLPDLWHYGWEMHY